MFPNTISHCTGLDSTECNLPKTTLYLPAASLQRDSKPRRDTRIFSKNSFSVEGQDESLSDVRAELKKLLREKEVAALELRDLRLHLARGRAEEARLRASLARLKGEAAPLEGEGCGEEVLQDWLLVEHPEDSRHLGLPAADSCCQL